MSPRRSAPLTLEHVLLAMLDGQPMHGYDLYQQLNRAPGISLVWNITQSLLYMLLEKLEERGLLSAQITPGEGHPPRKVFSLTEAGRASLLAWIASPVRRPRELRQEFLAKLIVARRYGDLAALELIQAQRQACLVWREQLQAGAVPTGPGQTDAWLVYSYRIERLRSLLDWLNTCEKELTSERSAG